MRRGVVLLMAALVGATGVLGVPARAVAPDRPTATTGSGNGSRAVASATYAEPTVRRTDVGIEAVVFVAAGNGRHLRAADCPTFFAERNAPATEVTALCEVGPAARG